MQNRKQSVEECGKIPNETKSNQVVIANNPKDYVQTKEDVDTNHMQKFDEHSPKLDVMLSQKSKKSTYCDINIENNTDSSMKANTEDVSNRSLSEIFEDKEMLDSSQDSHDPYNILKSAKLPSDLDSVSPIIFSALGPDIGSQVGNGTDMYNLPDVSKSDVITDMTEKGTVQLNTQHDGSDTYAAIKVQIETPQFPVDQDPNNESTSVHETIDISDNSQEDQCQPTKNENAPTKYFALPGNKDTIMVKFPKVTCTEAIRPTESNELNNIAQQYASKENVADQNSEENQANPITDSSEISYQSSDSVHSTSLEVSKNVNETYIQLIANGNDMLLDQNGQLKEVVYQETFTGQNITSVMEAALTGSKLPNQNDNDIGDEGDQNSASKALDKSTTESTSNDGDNSTEITASSHPTTNSTSTESNAHTHGHDQTTNNTDSGKATSKDDNMPHEDTDDACP